MILILKPLTFYTITIVLKQAKPCYFVLLTKNVLAAVASPEVQALHVKRVHDLRTAQPCPNLILRQVPRNVPNENGTRRHEGEFPPQKTTKYRLAGFEEQEKEDRM